MKRIDRSVPDLVKKKISDSMKAYHRQLCDDRKKQIAQKQSAAQRDYWATIPQKDSNEKVTVQDLVM